MTRLVLVIAAVAACADAPATGSIASAGMLNGMLNGMQHVEGLAAVLRAHCPELAQRVLDDGDLARPFANVAGELADPRCDELMHYTVQLMLPYGSTLTLFDGEAPVASYAGAQNLEHVVRRVYPAYSFALHAFAPSYPIARKVVTHGYAALTNGIHRVVSYRTGDAELDAHRAPEEDAYPREFLQLVPFTPAALAHMDANPAFLARQPDFFEPCYPHLTNYDYLSCAAVATRTTPTTDVDVALPWPSPCAPAPVPPPVGNCPVPIVVHGNLPFTDDLVPERTCRIRRYGETVPPGHTLNGDVIIPPGGCPLVYYPGRTLDETIYDERARNATSPTEGCDVDGPSSLVGCDFNVVDEGGMPIPDPFIEYYVFNVAPID